MCYAEYSIGVCPHCPATARFEDLSLKKNEREIRVERTLCHRQVVRGTCKRGFREKFLLHETHRVEWKCRQGTDKKDERMIKPCREHQELEHLKVEKAGGHVKRRAVLDEMLAMEKVKPNVPVKVVQETGGKWEWGVGNSDEES